MTNTSTISDDWRGVAIDAARALAIARSIASRHATADIPEAALLPAVLLTVAVTRGCAEISNRIAGVGDHVGGLSLCKTEDHLAGIAQELEHLAGIASEARRAGLPP